MARTRRGVVDQDSDWIIHEEVEFNPDEADPPQLDYIPVSLATAFTVHSAGDVTYNQIVIWGSGLISFGPVTGAQTAFMTDIESHEDPSGFPGDYIAFGYSPDPVFIYQYGLKADFFTLETSTSTVSVTADGISILRGSSDDLSYGFDFGGEQLTLAPSSNALLYFSDLDVTNGTAAADTLTGTAQPETLMGLGGDDWLRGNAGGDRLEGDGGNDLLEGGLGNDRLFGGDNDDTLFGGAGGDFLYGGNGNDVLAPGAGGGQVDGGAGTDRLDLDYSASATSIDFDFGSPGFIVTPIGTVSATNVEAVGIQGSQFVDLIEGTAFADQLNGGAGNDRLVGGGGNDFLDGGAAGLVSLAVLPGAGTAFENAVLMDPFFDLGDNFFVFNSTTVPHATLQVDVHTGPFESFQEIHRYLAVTVANGATITIDVDDTAFQVNSVVSIFDSSQVLVASNDDGDYFNGEEFVFDPGTQNGQDSLLTHTFGAAGTYYIDITTFIGTENHTSDFEVHFSLNSASVATADVLIGGTGNDTFVVNALSDQVIEVAGQGTDLVRTALTYTLGANVEDLVLTGAAAVNGLGNALANTINGNAANNILVGNDGADVLNGRGGADSMRGGDGNDTYYADNAGDRAVEGIADDGIDTVRSSVSFSLGANVETLVLGGTAALTGKGNDTANTILGNSGANVIDGRGGGDSMRGGLGNDVYVVDHSGDRVVEAAGAGTDRVNSAISFGLSANVENLTLTGTASIYGKGNALANTLLGNSSANTLLGYDGDDYLSGGAGNDRLYGGAGDDRLTGGAGVDLFYFDSALSAATNVDRVHDFAALDDSMVLDRSIFTAFAANGTMAASAFYAGTAAHDADDRILYDSASGRIYYDADGTGAAAKVLFAVLNAGTAITNADFVLVA